MFDIKYFRKIEKKAPIMIAGWPGMGTVALGVVEYMRTKLRAVRLAEIKMDGATTLDSVIVHSGIAKIPEPPRNIFYYSKDNNLILFQGDAQIPGKDGIALLAKVLDAAKNFQVATIFTSAAFPQPVSYKDDPELFGAVNQKGLRDLVIKSGIKMMESGHISGLNGLLMGFAEKRGIDSVCILSTMPQYAISLPNPKASMAIIEKLSSILDINIDLTELRGYAAEMDDKFAGVEDKVKDVIYLDKEHAVSTPPNKEIPPYIIDKIEKLFAEAKSDKSKALTLKLELDRWDLYGSYEDRFLDLFRGS